MIGSNATELQHLLRQQHQTLEEAINEVASLIPMLDGRNVSALLYCLSLTKD